MRGEANTALRAELPGVLPDNRIISGKLLYGEPLADLTAGAAYVRGIVSGLDRDGVGLLRTLAASPELKQLLLVVAVYGGSRTWDDVLFDLLGIQDSTPDHIQFRLLARRVGPDRPANLLWIQPSDGGHGHVVTGNVGSLLASARWDSTDAVMCLPLEPAAADALRKWFDNLHARSRGLTSETAAAPRLRPPEGDAEGERLWREYLELLDAHDRESTVGPIINADTGEVEQAAEPTPSRTTDFPRPDPVLLDVQTVLAKGSVVALDRASRSPPLDAPVKAELFGERAETRSGAARRQQRFSVSLFSEDVARRLEARKGAMSDRLAACSLMLRDGVRWVPDTADDLLKAEFAAVERDAIAALKAAIGEQTPADFVQATLEKIAKDCAALATMIAPGRGLPAGIVDSVKADLTARLGKNLEQGMVPGISRSRYQLVLSESEREGPWDQVQTFLTTVARLPREVVSDSRRMLGLIAKPEMLLTAFDVFYDPLVARYLDGRRVDDQARRELDLIKVIHDHATAKPKQRAYALFRLVKGESHHAVMAALTEEKTSQ
ncbi:MAG: hypothetical protein AB7F35_01755 [Acetobacteraceae bacterium]